MVVLYETSADGGDRPTDHSKAEDRVGAKVFDGHCEGSFKCDVGSVEDGGYVVELGSFETDSGFESEDFGIADV